MSDVPEGGGEGTLNNDERAQEIVNFLDDDSESEEGDLSDVSHEEDDDEDDDDASSSGSSESSGDDEALQAMLRVDHYDEDKLPEFACRYCGIHDPATVAKCVESQKWFCNGCPSGTSSHLVHHLVKSRSNQVQLHPESPLGDSVLECYNCATKNVFVLGFVPASSGSANSVVVLLCRVCVETVPALKDMDWDLPSWHPLIQDRQFLTWLLSEPPAALHARARQIGPAQMTRMEELWKRHPEAQFADLYNHNNRLPGEEGDDDEDGLEDLTPTEQHYEDGFHYQNILAPLVKVEADYDRQMKESLTEESIAVDWDVSLAGKWIATFSFHRLASESRVVVGDELRLKLGPGAQFLNQGKPWEGVGYVKSILDGQVELELRTSSTMTATAATTNNHSKKKKHRNAGGDNNANNKQSNTAATANNSTVPQNIREDYIVEYIWKATSYDRMQNALKTFALDDTSVTGYIYHKLLGHQVEEQRIATAKVPATVADFAVPGLPPLNESQRLAVASVLQRPLSLIQGPPGTGKTVTSATLVYHLTKQNMGQVLVTAPSNVAVSFKRKE